MRNHPFRSTCLRRMIAATTLALGACSDTPMQQNPPPPDDLIPRTPVARSHKIDMLFVVDNSPGMGPKHRKFAQAMPTLVNALRDDSKSPSLPDLRMAILTSDVGSGKSGACVPNYGDRGQLQMKGTCGQKADARWLANSPTDRSGKTYDGDDLAQVFGCLVTAVGETGCGYEQPLQSIHFALKVEQGNGVAAKDFIRPDAFLLIVLLTDEDDCSMPLDSVLANADLSSTEGPSLRCATRGHQCASAPLAYPTTQAFVADYATCAARTDTCIAMELAADSTTCTPLADIGPIAQSIKDYKLATGGSDDEILVAALFGTAREGQATTQYRIDRVPMPGTGQPGLFDLWPICSDSPSTPNTYPVGGVGYAGLRIQAFLDHFPKDRTLASSVCEADYAPALARLGALVRRHVDDGGAAAPPSLRHTPSPRPLF